MRSSPGSSNSRCARSAIRRASSRVIFMAQILSRRRAHHLFESAGQLGIELHSRALCDHSHRAVVRERLLLVVRPGHRFIDIADLEKTGHQRDLLPRKLIGIAAAVPTLMMAKHGARNLGSAKTRAVSISLCPIARKRAKASVRATTALECRRSSGKCEKSGSMIFSAMRNRVALVCRREIDC